MDLEAQLYGIIFCCYIKGAYNKHAEYNFKYKQLKQKQNKQKAQ